MNSVFRVQWRCGFSAWCMPIFKDKQLWRSQCCANIVRFSSSAFKNPFKEIVKSPSTSSTNDDRNSKSSSLIGRDLVSLRDFEKEDIHQFLWTAKDLKIAMKDGGEPCQHLQGKTAILYFDRDDVASRLSAELGIAKLGGHAAFYKTEDIGDVKQAGWLLSGLSDLIIMASNQQDVRKMADESHVPVVTGLSSLLNPLQVLTFFMTIQEYFGYLRGAKVAYVGEGGPTLNSLLYGCAKLGIDLSTATPPGSEPDIDVMLDATKTANKNGATFQLGDDPLKAVYRADVIITDTGKGTEGGIDAKYRISRKMLREAGGTWVFLHGLSQRSDRIAEVTEDILVGDESLVRQALENRLWTTMAVMLHLLVPYQPVIDKPKFVRG